MKHYANLALAILSFWAWASFGAASPSITTQPQDQVVTNGGNTTLSVVASGQSLFYQWYNITSRLTNDSHFSGATASTLTLSNVSTSIIPIDSGGPIPITLAGPFYVIVTNTHGSVTSSNAFVTILIPAQILSEPTNQSAVLNHNVSFSVVAGGTGPFGYRWYFNGTPLTDGGRISGSSTMNLSIANVQTNDAGGYQLIVTNHYGSDTSIVSTLTVLLPPVINSQPTNQSVVVSNSAVFSASAAGTGPLSYQWYFNNAALTDGGRVSGSTTATITITNAQTSDSGAYQLLVTNNYGAATSAVATLTVGIPPNFVVGPGNQTALPGYAATFSIYAAGTDPVSVRWMRAGTNLYDDGHISGAASQSLTISNCQFSDIGNYQVLLSNAFGSITSAPVSLVVAPVTLWGKWECANNDFPPALTNAFALAAQGCADLAIVSGTTPVAWGDSSSGQQNAPPLTNTVEIAVGHGHDLALGRDGSITGWGDNTYGESIAPADLTNVVSIGAGYQASIALKNDGTIVGWGSNAYALTNLPPGLSNVVGLAIGDFHALAIKDDGSVVGWGRDDSGDTVAPAGLSNVVAVAAGANFSVALKSDGTVVQWGYNPNCCGQINMPGGISNVTAIAAGFYQTVALKSDGSVIGWGGNFWGEASPPILTNAVAVAAGYYHSLALVGNPAVQIPPTIRWLGRTNHVVQPGHSALILPSVSGSLPMTFQWYFNGSPLSGETNKWLVLPSLQSGQSGNYSFIVTNGYGSATSMAVAIAQSPGIAIQPTNQSVIRGNTATFSATTLGDAPLGYQWFYNGVPLSDGGRISGSATMNLSIANVQTNDTGGYQLFVANAFGSTTSMVATLTVLVPATIVGQPTNQIALVGGSASFSVSAIGDAPLSYQWYSNNIALANGGRISGANSATLTISNVQTNDATGYQVAVANNYGAAQSSAALLTVLLPAQIVSNPSSQAVLIGSNVTFAAAGTGSSLNYQWFFNGTALSDGGRISGSQTPVLSITGVQASDAGGYVAVVSNLLSSAASRMATLTALSVLGPSVRYVNLSNSSPATPYLDWNTAATNIQDAIDASVAGDVVMVTNGTYNIGKRVSPGGASTNRVVVDKAIAVQSVNGPASTTIAGFWSAATTVYTRAVYLAAGSSLSGFTLTNSGTQVRIGDLAKDQSGGGVYCENSSVIVSNCILVGNHAYSYAGGAFGGTLINCILGNNVANFGGGATSNILIGCTITNNQSMFQNITSGGGVFGSTLTNCLLVANRCNGGGGGAIYSTLVNCVLSNNWGINGGGVAMGLAINSMISSNQSYSYGGGSYSNTLINCVIARNRVLTSAGGGAAYGAVTNCLFVGNSSANYGGGAYAALVNNCTFSNNAAEFGGGVALGEASYSLIFSNLAQNGGGAYSNLLNNCVLANNVGGAAGGGAYGGRVINCTVVSNSAVGVATVPKGGGIFGSVVTNSIVYYNFAIQGANYSNAVAMSYCCTTPLPTNGFGNITNAPLFVSLSNEDFHLQTNSPCINSGNNSAITNATDFGGNSRIVGGTVDIGAYEFQSSGSTISYAWLQQFGLPMDGSADNLDSDGDGFSNLQEWRAGTDPTNAAAFLKMDSAAPNSSSSNATVTWESVAGKFYFIQRANNLSAQPAFSTVQSNIIGQPGTTTYTDTNVIGGGPFFYRIGVQ